MVVRLLKNPYRGVNAHLHSAAQNPGEGPTIWTSFHAHHIAHITDLINSQLPLTYVARPEGALQIWIEEDEHEEASILAHPKPDVVMYRTGLADPRGKERLKRGPLAPDDPSVRILSIADILSETDYVMTSVVIHPVNEHGSLGRPDYNLDDNTVVYVIDVDSPLPSRVQIPLAGDDVIEFDFNRAYQYTFEIGRWGQHLDYAQPPRRFQSYSPADQERIKAVMARAAADSLVTA